MWTGREAGCGDAIKTGLSEATDAPQICVQVNQGIISCE